MSRSPITKETVAYIARLSRIHLEDKETGPLQETLSDILDYIEKLNELDVSNVEPTSHVLPLKNVHREDTPSDPLPVEAVMKMANENVDGFFKVPKVIE